MPKSPQDIYARHLLSPRGYPLWTPEPSNELLAFRREGLKIGDVGVVIPEDGCFDVFFNLCLPHDHPFHEATGVPDNFEPIRLTDMDLRTVANAENAGRIIATSAVKTANIVERSGDTSTRPSRQEYEFSLSSREGALLILPDGAESQDLRNYHLFSKAAKQHGADWYRFAEEKIGQIISHDSLYLITGFHKTLSWSLAAFEKAEGSGEYPAQCKLPQLGGGDIIATCTWNTTRALDWRVGPVDNYGIPNQAVFIRGFKIARRTILGDRRIRVKVDAPSTRPNRINYFGAVLKDSWLGRIFGGRSGDRSIGSSRSGVRGDRAADSVLDTAQNEIQERGAVAIGRDVVIQRFPEASQAFHPSDIINQYLFSKEPSANIAITHDDQWITLLEKDVLRPEDLVQDNFLKALVSINHDVVSKEGAVYLQSSDPGTSNVGGAGTTIGALGCDLNEVIVPARKALSLLPTEYPDHSASSRNPANHLSVRCEQLGGTDNLNDAVVLSREALLLCPSGHPDRPTSLNNLANHLSVRYQQLGGTDDLNEAIVLNREALSLCPSGHPDRPTSLNNLANHLSVRFERLGGTDDLNEAIVLDREALSLCPSGHPDRPMSLNNLANHLSVRFEQLGGTDDLKEAIVLDREALSLCPPGHPDCSTFLRSLANHLSVRYERLRKADDINEAIVLEREVLSLCPSGHPGRSTSLRNLANHLSVRYQQLWRWSDDLDEAIVLDREALSLCPPRHPNRPTSLRNLANHLSVRYQQHGRTDDLNEIIVLDREALLLYPTEHPDRSTSLSNLANHLSFRYEQLRGADDLNEVVVLRREALSLRQPGHPDRSTTLNDLAINLFSQYKHFEEFGDVNVAFEAKKELFSLYTELKDVSQIVCSTDLYAAIAWVSTAEKFSHPTTILAYETALRLLVQYSTALPSSPDLLEPLSSSLAIGVFSACLRDRAPTRAVEFFEQGRTVFWNQLAHPGSPLGDIVKLGPQGKELADEFTSLTSHVRNTLDSPGPTQLSRICHLNLELQRVVSEIRELPGFSRFLLPPLFSDLQRAAIDGPVIIMNASEYSCDALVVFADKDPVHIPLRVTKQDVAGLSSRLRGLKWIKMEMEREFARFLRDLWDRVISDIINVLQTTCPYNSRIWWCPTAEFSFLPLHAAAPFRKGQKGVSDLYVSSYTTTLTALIRARRPSLPNSTDDKRCFIAIGQAAAEDARELVRVGAELDNITQLVQSVAKFSRIEGEQASISNIAENLKKAEWVHFACHGIQSKDNPFEFAFALHNGRFPIQRIAQCISQNPEFAYLSACHTTVGGRKGLDEMIHLAAAMQTAGFRSVIGTMWAVNNSKTNKVISSFYKLMIDDSGRLDYTRAPRALQMTMKNMDIPIHQRMLYVHFGA